jgi:sugar phosphate isomerase/epimerase
MKTALHSVSYSGLIPGQHALTLHQFIDKAADLGFDGVMLAGKRPHASVLDMTAAVRREVRQHLEDRGLALACIAGYNNFSADAEHPDIPTREMQIQHLTELARLAHDLGGDKVRVFTAYEVPQWSFRQTWDSVVACLRECARRAADFGVTIGVQNHHDLAVHWRSLRDLLQEVNEPNCRAMFDAWSPGLQGDDLALAAREMAPWTCHTTVADYARRPRFKYDPNLVNYTRQPDLIQAVPMGEGFLDYDGFLRGLREGGYDGFVAYEMCSPLQGGGSEANLDRYARRFLEYMAPWR